MTTIPRIHDLSLLADTVDKDITRGSVFHIEAKRNWVANSAKVEFIAEEGRGKSFTYSVKNVHSLKELAEVIRLALFTIDCDLSWNGAAFFTDSTIHAEAANQRNWKVRNSDYSIKCWTLNGMEWEV